MNRRLKVQNPFIEKRTSPEDAKKAFLRHCRVKNLSPKSIQYYEEDITFFFNHVENISFVDEITLEVFEDFIGQQLDEGKKVSSLNTRIRGLRVFLNFCAEREYMEKLPIKLMKEDDNVKETYTEAEVLRLLKRPRSDRWVEWRDWAAVNYLVATGNRASTVLNLRVKDIDFENNLIFLSKLKNRRQQYIPLSPALKVVLTEYLKTWDSKPDDFLFASFTGNQMTVRSFELTIKNYNISRGVTRTGLHLFRHYFAKQYVLAGGGLVQLQALLGHSTLDMSKHYVNLYSKDLLANYGSMNPLDTIQQKAKTM